jgi:hypothetical protein
MKLTEFIIPTAMAKPGMLVGELFRECIARQVPGIPFQNATGSIIGKASMRNVLKLTCIPEYMIKHAALLGDRIEGLAIPKEKALEVFSLEVDPFVLSDMAVISRGTSMTKALAVMEQHDTTYLFVIDDEGYHGCLSIMGIGDAILRAVAG